MPFESHVLVKRGHFGLDLASVTYSCNWFIFYTFIAIPVSVEGPCFRNPIRTSHRILDRLEPLDRSPNVPAAATMVSIQFRWRVTEMFARTSYATASIVSWSWKEDELRWNRRDKQRSSTKNRRGRSDLQKRSQWRKLKMRRRKSKTKLWSTP